MHFLLLLLLSCASKPVCHELSELAVADQLERKRFMNATDAELLTLSKNDGARREKVLRLEKAGCLVTATNYSDAALIFQHGSTSSDYERAFRWSKKSYELGDETQKMMMALSLDRLLVSRGQRQLFGSQANRAHGQSCWCLEKIEERFSDPARTTYTGKSLRDQLQWLRSLNAGLDCKKTYCERELAPPEKNLIPEW
jgi:hypothetical protein